MKEQELKIRTPECDIVEKEYKDNLADIRLLVAKEYCTMIMGLLFFLKWRLLNVQNLFYQ